MCDSIRGLSTTNRGRMTSPRKCVMTTVSAGISRAKRASQERRVWDIPHNSPPRRLPPSARDIAWISASAGRNGSGGYSADRCNLYNYAADCWSPLWAPQRWRRCVSLDGLNRYENPRSASGAEGLRTSSAAKAVRRRLPVRFGTSASECGGRSLPKPESRSIRRAT